MTKVLLVDDNEDVVMIIKTTLQSRGFDVSEAGNGIEALEQIEKELPDIIISDIMMPEMDGFMLVRSLKKNRKTKAIPVIFHTAAYVTDEDREFGLLLGASRFLLKPFKPKELITEITEVLKESESNKLRTDKLEITDEEYLKKYSERLYHKLEIRMKKLDEEINKRKEVENAFQDSEEKFRSIAAAANDAIILMDNDGNIVYFNDAAQRIFEYSRQEVMNKELHSILVPEKYHDAYCKGFSGFRNTGQGPMIGKTIEVEAKGKDGTVFPVELSISALKLQGKWHSTGIVRDITERRRTEELVRQSEEKYRVLIDNIKEGVFIVHDSKLQFVNEAFVKQFGYSGQDIIGMNFKYLIAPEDRDIVADRYYRRLKGEDANEAFEFRGIRMDGTKIMVEINGGLINYRGCKAIMGTTHDITERKRAELELMAARDEALRASAVKSEFLSKMSHELRTPLNAVLGFSDILKTKRLGELNEKQEHYIDNIYMSGKHLLGIISDMLDLVKVESGEQLPLSMELFSAPEAIDETLIFVTEKAARKNIILKKEILPGLELINADKLRFKQILLILIENAIKFSKPRGGTVTITAGKTDGMAQFSVSDTGIGIREEDTGKLFSLFHQVDSGMNRRYGGTGIGLAITRQLVEQHGGRIWVESRYGEGSTFTFTLPC